MRIYYDKQFKNIKIQYGVSCLESFCPYAHKCKRKEKYWWHNFCAKVNIFFKYRLKLPIKVPFYRTYNHSENLSGTPLCPFKLPRRYDCYGCEYGCGDRCMSEQRSQDIRNGCRKKPEEGQYCAYMKTLPWDINTGKILWEDA